jgi:hypothetical protein
MSYAPPGYAQPGYAQPGYAQPGYAQPGYAGYAPPGYAPGWGRQWWNGPNGPVPYGMPYGGPWGTSTMGTMGQTLASGLGTLIEAGTGLVAAFQSLPTPPTAAESELLFNVTDYQRKLAEHAKGDERIRTIGTIGGKVVDLAIRLFSNPSSGPGPFTAPRWY